MTEIPTTTQHKTETPRPALAFDAQEFAHFLADCDWTEGQKIEFIETLWQIVLNFVDLGFDLHPVQRVIDAPSTLELESSDVLESSDNRNLQTLSTGLDQLVGAGRRDS